MINPRLRRGSDGGAAAAQDRWNQGEGATGHPHPTLWSEYKKKSPLKGLVLHNMKALRSPIAPIAIEKIKILGAVLELPAKQHNLFTMEMGQMG